MDMIPKPQPGRISPYKAYGAAVTGHRRLGRMLKYDKSSWLAGTSAAAVLIEIGTELVAIIPTLRIGWVKFVGGELVDSRMGLLSESFVMPRRNELDDFDGANWEKRPDGSTKDPWSRNNELVLVSPGDDEIFTYCTGSRGGLSAIGELCSAFNDELPFYPLVALGDQLVRAQGQEPRPRPRPNAQDCEIRRRRALRRHPGRGAQRWPWAGYPELRLGRRDSTATTTATAPRVPAATIRPTTAGRAAGRFPTISSSDALQPTPLALAPAAFLLGSWTWVSI